MRILRSPIADGRFIDRTRAVFGGVTGAVRHSFLGEALIAPVEGGASYGRVRFRPFGLHTLRRVAMCSGAYATRVRLCAVAYTPNVFS